MPGPACPPALCLALPHSPCCQNWAVEEQTRPAGLEQLGQGMSTELQQPPDPVWDELCEGKVAVLEAQGVAASGGGFISCQ